MPAADASGEGPAAAEARAPAAAAAPADRSRPRQFLMTAAMETARAYDAWYETPRGRWVGNREHALLLEALAPRPGESILDVGSGTGYFTRRLAAAVEGAVTGVDLNADWLGWARRRGGGPAYVAADAADLPFADQSVDLVASVTAVGFVADERRAVAEMVRVARRRIVLGLLNRRSLLWWGKGRGGGRGAWRGAKWHTPAEARALFTGLPVQDVRVRTAIHWPGSVRAAALVEGRVPAWLHTGAFLLVTADAW